MMIHKNDMRKKRKKNKIFASNNMLNNGIWTNDQSNYIEKSINETRIWKINKQSFNFCLNVDNTVRQLNLLIKLYERWNTTKKNVSFLAIFFA